MFATPFSAPMPPRFASQVFGRFMSRTGSLSARDAAVPAEAIPAMEDDTEPDLAQRVREVGEW